MNNTHFHYLLFLFIALSLSNFTCFGVTDGPEFNGRVNIRAEITPQNKTFFVGDTITLSHSLPSKFKLDNTIGEYDNSNEFINYYYDLAEVRSNNKTAIPANDRFDIIPEQGNIQRPDRITEEFSLLTMCNDSICQFEIHFIPQDEGIFLINFNGGEAGDEFISIYMYPEAINADNNNSELCSAFNTTRIRYENSSRTLSDNLDSLRTVYFFEVVE